MLSEYDEQIDTVTQVIIDWFTKIIKTMPDFKDDQIYESTLLIDDRTPLPCIGFYRNRISPYEGKDLCADATAELCGRSRDQMSRL